MYYPESPAATGIAEATASPAAEPTQPFVVYVYGGAWETGSTGQFAHWVLGTADGGFIVAEVSYRPGHEAPFPTQTEDVCEGIDWLTDRADEFGIDTDTIAVVGHSAGAHLALLAVLSSGKFGRRTDIDAAVGVSGVYDLRIGDHEHTGKPLPLFENWPSITELRRCSPITCVDDDTDVDADASPTLLLHGSKDPVIAPDRSTRLAGTLEGAGIQVEYDTVNAVDYVFLHSSYHYPTVRKRMFSFLRELL